MIQRLVAFAIRMPFIILATAALLVVGGVYAYSELNIEAYPNPVPPMVEVITQPDGWSAEEVERYVTVPLEIGLAGMPGLDHVRSQSLFGLSDIKCYFKWGVNYSDARQEVITRFQFVDLPAQPQLSPWNAIGELVRYRLKGKGYSTADLKTAQDWVMERQLKQVPGVIDVTGFGGTVKQYQILLDMGLIRRYGVTLQMVVDAINKSNANVGGDVLPLGTQAHNVRSLGLLGEGIDTLDPANAERAYAIEVEKLEDIQDVVIASYENIPVYIKQIAKVIVGEYRAHDMVCTAKGTDVTLPVEVHGSESI